MPITPAYRGMCYTTLVEFTRNSLVAHWLGFCTFHCHGLGLIPGQGSKNPQPKKKKKRKEFIKEVTPIYFFFNRGLALVQEHIREWKFGRENFFGKTIRSKATYSVLHRARKQHFHCCSRQVRRDSRRPLGQLDLCSLMSMGAQQLVPNSFLERPKTARF